MTLPNALSVLVWVVILVALAWALSRDWGDK